MRFLWDLFWNPVWALDMLDPKTQRPAYSKVLGLLALLVLVFFAVAEVFFPDTRALSTVKWSLLFAAPFGVLGLRTWFANRKGDREETPFRRRHLPTEPSTEPDLWTDDERGD